MAFAGGDDRSGKRLDFELPPGEAVEIHRSAELAGERKQRRQRAGGFIVGEFRAIGAPHRDGFVEDGEAKLLDVRPPQHLLPLQRERGDRIGDGIDQQFAPQQSSDVGCELYA